MEKFSIDKQTLKDLNIQGKFVKNSIFSLYNYTLTKRGEFMLEQMFNNPLTDRKLINDRASIIKDFCNVKREFDFNGKSLETMIHYLSDSCSSNYVNEWLGLARRRMLSLFSSDKEYEGILDNVCNAIDVLNEVRNYFVSIEKELKNSLFYPKVKEVVEILTSNQLISLEKPTTFSSCFKCEYTLRKRMYNSIQTVIKTISESDVYQSVAKVTNDRGFVAAECIDAEDNVISINQVYHPFIKKAVANNIDLSADSNVIFLTGANMAGKSTFMKSYGVAIYLAHMGFPIAAKSMRFTPQDGIYTSINVPDNLDMGYSHFYAEVVRVKYIAQEVAQNKRLVIMFDELFKGTNVKDAYDATVAITGAFARKQRSSFIVSTHIMEAGETLREMGNNIQFKYLPTILEDDFPRYTYTLADGIADDRHGMRIINNERVIEIIKKEYYEGR